ncbi:MAG: acyl carrier protein [Christensenellales bacterium]
MNRCEIEETVREQIQELTGSDEAFGLDERLKEDLGLDSLSLVTVIVGIEDSLGIRFDDADLAPERILTPSDLAELIEKYYEDKSLG